MRRLLFSIVMATGLVMVGPSSAFADDPAPTVSVKATPGKKICKVTDPLLDELSGIVATKTGFIVINDSTNVDSHKRVFFLNDKCKIVNEKAFSGRGPFDTEDMILSPDGRTIWIADTGDDAVRNPQPSHRPNVALWTMPADGSSKPTIHRLSYPPGDYHDAEALLLNGNSTPLIVTKELGKPASIYQPAAALKSDNVTGVPMKKVGEITVSATETPGNPVARIGNRSITGGAVALGGDKVVLRTYTDALEWDVTGGDVLAAVQKRPRTTGLPNEPFGEAISYSADGKTFLTVSDMNGDKDTANDIEQYTPATTVAAVKKSSDSGSGGGAGGHWYSDLTIGDITYLVGAVGVLGLILVGVGVLGIVRFRKRTPADRPGGVDGFADDSSGDPETELIGVGGLPERAGMYAAPGAASGAAYGRPPVVSGRPGNGVYGGAPQYARPPQDDPPPRGGQQPPRGGQQPARGGQQPARGGQQPARGGQQPARGGQEPPRGGQQPPRDQQPARGPQPARGQQPPRAQQPSSRNGVYGGAPPAPPPSRAPQPPRGPAAGQRPQGGGQYGGSGAPRGQSGPGPAQRPAGPAQRPDGPGQRPDGPGQRPAGGGGGTYGQDGRPEGRYDNPGYGRG